MKHDYDLIVIGGGAAGLTAAGMSAVLGAKTALVSSARLGGDCTWHGCIPSKSLLKAAKVAHAMRSAAKYGLTPVETSHNWKQIIGRVHGIQQGVYEDADAPPNMEKLGVEVIAGQARFTNRNCIELTAAAAPKKILTSRFFVIATGSAPVMPKLPGADYAAVLTNENLFGLDRLPLRLLVLGAGPIGVEMAQAFRRLGSEVTVVGRSQRILVRDDPELANMLAKHLQSEGVHLLLDRKVERLESGLAYVNTGERIEFDAVLAATGRRPVIENLDIESAGVVATEKGIVVDRHCRTSAKNIFACGDVTGKHLFTHMAEHTAKVAVTNAILHVPASTDEGRVSWCTFTDPELAHVGIGEAELRRRGAKFRIYRVPFSQLDRAITESESTGLVKVFANSRGTILGASILGANAGEMIAEYALAMRARIGLGAIASTIHPYPTYALANRRAADVYVTNRLTPFLVSLLKRLFRLRGSTRGILSLNTSVD